MDLINFSSFFEIFAALNLGYASFDYFRNLLNNAIFKRGSSVNKLEELKIELKLILKDADKKDDLKGVDKFVDNGKSRMLADFENLNNEYNTRKNFLFEIFKPISLILSIYCLTVLIIAAFQSQIGTDGTYKICSQVSCTREDLTFFVFLLALMTSSYSFIIFFSSISEKILSYKIKMSVTTTIVMYILGIIISYLIVHFTETLSNIQIILIYVISPIVLVFVFLSIYFSRNKDFINDINKKWEELKKKSFSKQIKFFFPKKKSLKFVFIYLLIIFVFALPVNIYLSTSSTNMFFSLLVVNTIVLMNPILLYVFLAFRVFIYQKFYASKYSVLHETYGTTFDSMKNFL
ncbi:hypothetical protein [Flavivirga sp. 57AJ16]|uniref:hypothetical protein n=1 Tax=Flavivirga sp. 57AJ16 TaxID=3025307 RepID=UPI0023661C94|nr:hypothetical protein [Flavivirga sp. 57AJ16]MDD7887872.1 hypothetical protein [Flavivirga sp. 57AJ16]